MARKENGVDVDVWNMHDLVEVVQEFVREQDAEADAQRYGNPDNSISEESPSGYDVPVVDPSDNVLTPSKSEVVSNHFHFGQYEELQKTDTYQPEEYHQQDEDNSAAYFSRRDQIMSGDPIPQDHEGSQHQGYDHDYRANEHDNYRNDDEDRSPKKTNTSKPVEHKVKEEDKDVDPKVDEPKMVKQHTSSISSVFGLKMPLTELNRIKDLKIEVIGTETIDEGFFSAKYLSFKLRVIPLDLAIERRDKDFNYLRDCFSKMYPHILIPPISAQKTTKKYDEWYTHKRTNIIQRFVNK